MKNLRGFASDNNAGVHPEIMKAIEACNQNHVVGYGADPYTERTIEKIIEVFGKNTYPFFVFNGTAANVLSLRSMMQSYESVICSDTAHIHEDECGAPEFITGSKVIPVHTPDGKLTIEAIKPHVKGIDFEHHSQPRVVSITQATELGTIYTPDEIRKLAHYVHANNMLLHMDGARIANAAASLGLSLREITRDAGVDVLSFGGTKNGAMYGELVLFFHECNNAVKYIRKQSMQLASKMRYIAVQFEALLTNDLWKRNAEHANKMAQLLAEKVSQIPEIEIVYPVQANGVFAAIPSALIKPLQDEFFFYIWDEPRSEVRWMTSWDTTEDDIERFVKLIDQKMRDYLFS